MHWRSSAEEEAAISVPSYLEQHAYRIRNRYVAFIHDLGEMPLGNCTVSQYLEDGQGNNFWWMGLIAEKSPFKSPEIYQALRLIALEDLLNEKSVKSLVLHTDNGVLVKAIRALCHKMRIAFTFHLISATGSRGICALSKVQDLPQLLQMPMALLSHLGRRWPLRNNKPLNWHRADNAVLFCSYFAHLDLASANNGEFYSRQWGKLPKLLTQNSLRLNWLQNYWPGDAAVDANAAVALARKFNAASEAQGVHGFVDAYLSAKVVFRALRSWLFVCGRAWRLRNLYVKLQSSQLPVYLWPVLRSAWNSSTFGRVSIANCLAIHLFDAALRDIPRQKHGYYLFENQAWEKAFLNAWRKHGHGHITGVVHATVPFWHLYYVEDPRTLKTGLLPMPDFIAVNGEVARKALLSQGHSADKLVSVEALRYLELAQGITATVRSENRLLNGLRVLIVGDMEVHSLHDLLCVVKQASQVLPKDFLFTFKPHPAYMLDPKSALGLDIPVVSGDLALLLDAYDCVIAGNSTSASVDALLAGKQVMIASVGKYLNLSPLRGWDGVSFFETSPQLVSLLLNSVSEREQVRVQDEYFYLNRKLPRWRRLFGLHRVNDGANTANKESDDDVISEKNI
jgi:surface carbohydrate biosynthesis protein (TIGR04326 family)